MTVAELVPLLDLYVLDTEQEMRVQLADRRQDHLAALAAPSPFDGSSASLLRLRVTRLAEIRLIDETLGETG